MVSDDPTLVSVLRVPSYARRYALLCCAVGTGGLFAITLPLGTGENTALTAICLLAVVAGVSALWSP